jgi:hypothetical protein
MNAPGSAPIVILPTEEAKVHLGLNVVLLERSPEPS